MINSRLFAVLLVPIALMAGLAHAAVIGNISTSQGGFYGGYYENPYLLNLHEYFVSPWGGVAIGSRIIASPSNLSYTVIGFAINVNGTSVVDGYTKLTTSGIVPASSFPLSAGSLNDQYFTGSGGNDEEYDIPLSSQIPAFYGYIYNSSIGAGVPVEVEVGCTGPGCSAYNASEPDEKMMNSSIYFYMLSSNRAYSTQFLNEIYAQDAKAVTYFFRYMMLAINTSNQTAQTFIKNGGPGGNIYDSQLIYLYSQQNPTHLTAPSIYNITQNQSAYWLNFYTDLLNNDTLLNYTQWQDVRTAVSTLQEFRDGDRIMVYVPLKVLNTPDYFQNQTIYFNFTEQKIARNNYTLLDYQANTTYNKNGYLIPNASIDVYSNGTVYMLVGRSSPSQTGTITDIIMEPLVNARTGKAVIGQNYSVDIEYYNSTTTLSTSTSISSANTSQQTTTMQQNQSLPTTSTLGGDQQQNGSYLLIAIGIVIAVGALMGALVYFAVRLWFRIKRL